LQLLPILSRLRRLLPGFAFLFVAILLCVEFQLIELLLSEPRRTLSLTSAVLLLLNEMLARTKLEQRLVSRSR